MSATEPVYHYPPPVGSHRDALATVEYGGKRYAVTLMAGRNVVPRDTIAGADKVAALIGKLLRAHELRPFPGNNATLQTMDDTGLHFANGSQNEHTFTIYNRASAAQERQDLAADLASAPSTGGRYTQKNITARNVWDHIKTLIRNPSSSGPGRASSSILRGPSTPSADSSPTIDSSNSKPFSYLGEGSQLPTASSLRPTTTKSLTPPPTPPLITSTVEKIIPPGPPQFSPTTSVRTEPRSPSTPTPPPPPTPTNPQSPNLRIITTDNDLPNFSGLPSPRLNPIVRAAPLSNPTATNNSSSSTSANKQIFPHSFTTNSSSSDVSGSLFSSGPVTTNDKGLWSIKRGGGQKKDDEAEISDDDVEVISADLNLVLQLPPQQQSAPNNSSQQVNKNKGSMGLLPLVISRSDEQQVPPVRAFSTAIKDPKKPEIGDPEKKPLVKRRILMNIHANKIRQAENQYLRKNKNTVAEPETAPEGNLWVKVENIYSWFQKNEGTPNRIGKLRETINAFFAAYGVEKTVKEGYYDLLVPKSSDRLPHTYDPENWAQAIIAYADNLERS